MEVVRELLFVVAGWGRVKDAAEGMSRRLEI